ncbi:MAG: SpoIIE family protein phosphatase [Acidimicrobiia bacterium]
MGAASNECGNEIRLEADLGSVAHPVWLLDADGSVLDLNESARRGGAFDRSTVVGRRFWDVAWWPDRPLAPMLLRAGHTAALTDGDAHVHLVPPAGGGSSPTVDVTFSLTPSGGSGEGVTVVAQAPPRDDTVFGTASSRYVGLRRLGAGLASAITVDEVINAITERIAPAVGACLALVVEAGEDPRAGTGAAIPDELTPAIAAAIDGTVDVVVDDPDVLRACGATIGTGPGSGPPARLTVHPMPQSPTLDLPAIAVVLAWSAGSLARGADQDAGDVLALCGAAIHRAQATKRAGELTVVMDALDRRAPIGIAYFDADLRVVHVNERLAAIMGTPPADQIGCTVREVAPELADTIEAILEEVATTGRPTEKIEILGTLDARTGEPSIWESAFVPVTDRAGATVGVAAIVEDITERRRTLEELERLYERERTVADRLQQGLRPARLPVPEGYEMATRYRAGTFGLRVGGDWYDLITLGSDRYGLVIGDVVGHGLDAALTMTSIHHALAGLCHAIAKPGPLLDRLDDYLTHDGDRYVATLFYGLLEPSTGHLTFSSAGHPPALLVTADGVSTPLMAGRGVPLGITGKTRPDANVVLEPGDTLVLYTDGILERRGEPFDVGLERLIEASSHPVDDLNDFASHLLAEVPDPGHSDDIALLVLRRRADVDA